MTARIRRTSSIGAPVKVAAGFVRSAAAELLTAGALIAGWLLITAGIATLTTRAAWYISVGLLLISLAGWKLCWTLATEGLYALTRGADA